MSFTKHLQKQDKKTATIKRYKNEVEKLELFTDPITCNYNTLLAYFTVVAKHGYTSGTVAVIKASIESFFDYLIREGKRVDNPARLIQVGKKNRQVKFHELLTTEELDSILVDRTERYSLLKWRNLLILSMVRYQALTNSDLVKLTVDSIDGEGDLKVEVNGKMVSNTYQLHPKQMTYFYKYLEQRNKLVKVDTNALLITKLGTIEKGDGISYLFECLRKDFPNKKVDAKSIRKAVIVEHYDNCKNIRMTQKFARHKWTSTTSQYVNVVDEDMIKQIEELHPILSL